MSCNNARAALGAGQWLIKEEVDARKTAIDAEEAWQLLAAADLVVAAAGNGGPNAPPAYPAAYEKCVSVTAIDHRLRPYSHANRGEYLTVAAPGVRIWTPGWPGGKYRTGTSYAAPHVTAAVALIRRDAPNLGYKELHRQVQQHSYDLGAPGKDPVFGWGLLKAPMACE